jgi:hypothetical protein
MYPAFCSFQRCWSHMHSNPYIFILLFLSYEFTSNYHTTTIAESLWKANWKDHVVVAWCEKWLEVSKQTSQDSHTSEKEVLALQQSVWSSRQNSSAMAAQDKTVLQHCSITYNTVGAVFKYWNSQQIKVNTSTETNIMPFPARLHNLT